MITMTKEQYNKLQPYEDTLFNALHFGFARLGDPQMVSAFNSVSMALFNDGITGACGHCALRKLKNIARPYFQLKEELQKKAEEEAKKKAEEQAQKEKEELEKKIAEEGKTQPINNNNRINQKNNATQTIEKPKRTGRGKGSR